MDNTKTVFVSFLVEKDPDLSISIRLDLIEAVEDTSDGESIIYMGSGRECAVKASKSQVLETMIKAHQASGRN